MSIELIRNIANKKLQGIALTSDEINLFIKSLLLKQIPDEISIDVLRAMHKVGLDFNETKALTAAYVNSGQTLDLSSLGPFVVDKHSTGGVGDKVSLILVPWLASVGAKILKLSGRSLGFTGGTIDKLESIPGFSVNKPIPALIDQVNRIGCGITGAGPNLCPADKITYALRDANNLFDEKGLIAASVLSKKIAGGAKKVVIDLKVGDGAFMKTISEARKLAQLICDLALEFDIKLSCVLTRMDNPLGLMIGNANEVAEAFNFIEYNNATLDLLEVSLQLGIELLLMSDMANHEEMARDFMLVNLEDGNAFKTLENWIREQTDSTTKLPIHEPVLAAMYFPKINGYIKCIKAKAIGEFVRELGAGRQNIYDKIHPNVGVQLFKQKGAKVKTETPLLSVFHTVERLPSNWKSILDDSIEIVDHAPKQVSTIIDTIRNW